jgi:predicted PurR-regulated permease PerM
LFGVGSVLISRASARLVTPDEAWLGLAKMALVSMARMIAVAAAIAAYFLLVRPGFVAFALALVTSFLATLVYEAVKASSSTRRSARTS